MKILYLAKSQIPSRSANSIHVMKMCEALSSLNHNVTLLTISNNKLIEKKVSNEYKFYGVKKSFDIKRFPWFNFRGYIYLYSLLIAVWSKWNGIELVYSRFLVPCSILTFFKIKVIHEFHIPNKKRKGLLDNLIKNFFYSKFLVKVVSISNALKIRLIDDGVPKTKIIVAHDAAEPQKNKTKQNIQINKIVVGYLGHLYKGKGIEIIEKIHNKVPHQFMIVGGTTEDINYWKKRINASNVSFVGFVPKAKVSSYLKKMDIVLLPNQRVINVWNNDNVNISEFTSPLKLFDYMSHGLPIIASKLDVLMEVLNENNSILCDPENESEWINAIEKLSSKNKFRQQISNNAYNDFLKNYTWKKRAVKILNSIKI